MDVETFKLTFRVTLIRGIAVDPIPKAVLFSSSLCFSCVFAGMPHYCWDLLDAVLLCSVELCFHMQAVLKAVTLPAGYKYCCDLCLLMCLFYFHQFINGWITMSRSSIFPKLSFE